MRVSEDGKEFHFCNGQSAKSVKELVNQIEELSPEEFTYHVNKEKNDFYNWINECIDSEVADDIKNAHSQRVMIEKLTGHHWHHHHKKKHGY